MSTGIPKCFSSKLHFSLLVGHQPVMLHEILPLLMQDFVSAEICEVPTNLFLQPAQAPLNSSLALHFTNHFFINWLRVHSVHAINADNST